MPASAKKRGRQEEAEADWCTVVAELVVGELGLITTSNRAKNTVSFAVRTGTRVDHRFFDELPRGSYCSATGAMTIVISCMHKVKRIESAPTPPLNVSIPTAFEEHRQTISERLQWSAQRATIRQVKPYKLVTQKAFHKLLVIANLECGSRFTPRATDFDYWLERGSGGWMLVSVIEL